MHMYVLFIHPCVCLHIDQSINSFIYYPSIYSKPSDVASWKPFAASVSSDFGQRGLNRRPTSLCQRSGQGALKTLRSHPGNGKCPMSFAKIAYSVYLYITIYNYIMIYRMYVRLRYNLHCLRITKTPFSGFPSPGWITRRSDVFSRLGSFKLGPVRRWASWPSGHGRPRISGIQDSGAASSTGQSPPNTGPSRHGTWWDNEWDLYKWFDVTQCDLMWCRVSPWVCIQQHSGSRNAAKEAKFGLQFLRWHHGTTAENNTPGKAGRLKIEHVGPLGRHHKSENWKYHWYGIIERLSSA